MDKDGKAIFEAAEELEDAKVYTVTSEDLSVPANTTVTAEVANAYAKDFFTETKKVAVLDGGKTHTNIVVKVKDQYGNVMNDLPEGTAIEGALNGMPLKGDIKIENGKVTVSNQNLKAEDELTFTLSYVKDEEKKETITSEEFKFELEKGEKAEATTIDAVTDDQEGKEILPTVGNTLSNVKLTADVRDQYGNEVNVEEEGIRWVVTKGADLIKITVDGEEQDLTKDPIIDGEKTLEFEAVDSGDVVIEAYLKSKAGEKATYTTTIGVVEVSKLTFEPVKGDDGEVAKVITTNKSEKAVVLGTVKPNSGATIKPEDVKFKVTKKGDDDKQVAVPEGVVEAKAVYAKDAEGKETDEIQVEVKATETGEYTVTPYVVVDGKEVVAETPGTFTSGPEGTIDEIVIDYKAKNEKVEKGLEIPVTFKNEHGEEIQQGDNKVNVTTSNSDITPKLVEQLVDGKPTGKMVLKFYTEDTEDYTAVQAGVARITLQSGDVIETVDVKFVGAKITTVEVTDAKAEIIAGENEDPVYNQVTFFDQDNEEMAKPEDTKATVVDKDGEDVTGATATIVDVYFNDKGEIVRADENTTVPTFKAVEVTASDKVAAGDYKVVVTAQAEDKENKVEEVSTSFDLTVNEVRTLETIEIDPTKSTVSFGADSVSTVKLTDQYGKAMAAPKNIKVKLMTKDEEGKDVIVNQDLELVEVTKDEESVVGEYTLTIPEKIYKSSGNFTIVVESEVKEATDATEAVVKKAVADLSIVTGSKTIAEANIVSPGLIGENGEALHYVKSGQEVTFEIEAFDKDGNQIVTAANDSWWTVDGAEGQFTPSYTVTAPTLEADEKEREVTVKMDVFGNIVKEFTFIVKNDDSVAQKDTLKATTLDKDGKPVKVDFTEGIVIDENSPNGAVELTFTATDQYGQEMTSFGNLNPQSLDASVATVAKEGNNKVVVTAVKEGNVDIRTVVDLNDVRIPVIVTKEAVEAKEAASAADAALNTAKDALKDKEAEDYTEETWEKVTEAQEMPETTTEEKNAKAKAINEAVEGLKTKEEANAEAADAALQKAVDSIPQDLDEEGKYTTDSVQAVKDAQAKPEETTENKNAKAEAINKAVKELELQADADKKAVDAALGKVKDSYEAAEGTEDTADKKIAAVKEAVEKDVANEEVKVEITEEDGTFTVTLTKGDAKETKDITITIAQ